MKYKIRGRQGKANLNSSPELERSSAVAELVALAESDPSARRDLVARRAIVIVGEHVRTVREKAKLTQKELAACAGLTQARVSIIENGASQHGPSVDVLARISHACGHEFLIVA